MNTHKILTRFLSIFLMFAILLSACGGGEATLEGTQPTQPAKPEATEEPAPQATEKPAPVEATDETPTGLTAVSAIRDVKSAVIQIEAQGTFVDPQYGLVFNAAGRGSGFIIDPSGLAVTNNHVVTGSALLRLWVGGDQSQTYNAKVLGVSECSDLAVIDIQGEGFPFLSWSDLPIEVGQEIYVAGFPLGDPEYSLTKGIISKAKAGGETTWASVESVLEYDATTNPGNSGGPVVDPDGHVLAVHYSGNSDTDQAFGISRNFAQSVIDVLKTGEDLDTIGINGQAVWSEDGSLTGIWVSSIKSGSPADKAGIVPGDILTQMEGLVLATDQTMSDYCDILRSHEPSDTLNISILRLSTGEILEGQINGRELAVVGVLDDSGNENTNEASNQPGVIDPSAYGPGEVFFIDEFDDELTEWTYFLTSGKESTVSSSIGDSVLRLEFNDNREDTYLYFTLNDLVVSDVRIDIKAENRGRNNNNVSLICRYSDQDGWYEFNIANNGLYWIYRYNPNQSPEYIELAKGGSTEIRMGQETNEYIALCQGDQLTLGINGVEVRTITDKGLKSGLTGFSVSSFQVVPIIIELDYFALSNP